MMILFPACSHDFTTTNVPSHAKQRRQQKYRRPSGKGYKGCISIKQEFFFLKSISYKKPKRLQKGDGLVSCNRLLWLSNRN
jgi:hypothetical protein